MAHWEDKESFLIMRITSKGSGRIGWGRPSFAKKYHYFERGQGSACGIYDPEEVPTELLRTPGDYSKICDGCLLALAKAYPEALVGDPE